jgi:hypothetical protein
LGEESSACQPDALKLCLPDLANALLIEAALNVDQRPQSKLLGVEKPVETLLMMSGSIRL